MDRAQLADFLTFSRILLTPVVAWFLAAQWLEAAAILLVVAWSTDTADGQAARQAQRPTRMSAWDLRVDSWLAVGQGLGLGLGGYISWWLVGPISLLVLIASVTLINPAPAMVGTGVLTFFNLGTLVTEDSWWWLPVGFLALLLVIKWKRFWGIIMVSLWNAVVELAKGRRSRRDGNRRMVVDDWA